MEERTTMVEPDLTTDEVAAALRLNRVTIQRWLKSGRLRGYQIGRSWRVPREAMEELRAAAQRGGERPPPRAGGATQSVSAAGDEEWEQVLLAEDDQFPHQSDCTAV
jgi:excisionase family DNA binding protein